MDNLIYDRTETDVEIALNNPNSTKYLKGAYNFTDLNRVEEWCEFLEKMLNLFGSKLELEIKKDWTLQDTLKLRLSEIDRIRNNVTKLKECCTPLNENAISYDSYFNFEDANLLEKILYDIDKLLKDMNVKGNLKYNVAAALFRGSFEHFKVNTDTIIENKKYNSIMGVGYLLIQNDYITLKAE